jgi:hypothetical protein
MLPAETVLLIRDTSLHQRLPFLHGHRPVVHHQGINEPGQIFDASGIPHERSLH